MFSLPPPFFSGVRIVWCGRSPGSPRGPPNAAAGDGWNGEVRRLLQAGGDDTLAISLAYEVVTTATIIEACILRNSSTGAVISGYLVTPLLWD